MGRLTPGDFRKNFIKESLEIKVARARQSFDFYRASIGNPHAVILCDKAPGEEYVKIYGPLIERHKYFEDRTNVQFVYVKNSKSLQLKIWERGAGYTLSSGSSASAAAGIAYHLRLIKNEVKVYMPGGVLDVSIADDLTIVQSGPVSFIGSCQFLYQ